MKPFPCKEHKIKLVDGWMDGWMDGWVGGWVNGWVGGCMHACILHIEHLVKREGCNRVKQD